MPGRNVPTLVVFKCTRCEHTTEQYSYVKAVYHEGCRHAAKGTVAVLMVPIEEDEE